ncbi:MAG: bifunctional oligoribonuclease/PAP phosphatase NrnA [Brevinematales bacterium]|jgi:phosphoesterase RecJ-like protein
MKKIKKIYPDSTLKKSLKELHKIINKSKAVMIAGHVSPDGDDIASQLALGEYFKNTGKKYVIAWTEDIPRSFRFLPGSDSIVNIKKKTVSPDDFDLIIIVDSGDFGRIGDIKDLIKPAHFVVNIDHHMSNTRFGSLNIVVEKACSIGEILYYYFTLNSIPITLNIASDLYVSIVTDTGSFNYDCMHPEVHRIAADLLRLGVVPADFHILLSQNKTASYMKLLTKTLTNLELFEDSKIAVSHLAKSDFLPGEEDDTDGIIEYLGMLDAVSVYVLIKEKTEGSYSASLRSKHNVDVAKVASNFNGGGHMRAAGCRTDKLSLDEFKSNIIGKIKEQLYNG